MLFKNRFRKAQVDMPWIVNVWRFLYVSVYFCESFSSLEIELMKVPSVFFPRGTLQYQTSSEWLKFSVARGLCHKHESAGFSLDR